MLTVSADRAQAGKRLSDGFSDVRVPTPFCSQVLLSHLGMRQGKDLALATLPERGGNVGGMVELRFSADGGLTW